MTSGFKWSRIACFYETDAMGVVHHSNYLRLFEEARTAWLRHLGCLDGDDPLGNINFAVIESQIKHKLPIYFNDEINIFLKMRLDKLKLRFKYAICTQRFGAKWAAEGITVHVPVNRDLKVVRLPKDLRQVMEKESWIEI